MEESIIKSIFTISGGWYTNVRFKGSHKNFEDEVYGSKFIRIYCGNKEIYLNTDNIASFELEGD